MVFSSVTFLFFFLPFTITAYLLLRDKKVARNIFLLIMSLFFYYWGEKIYTILMVSMIVVNYLFGLWLSKAKKRRRLILVISVIFNLTPIAFYKYTNFFMDNVNHLLQSIGAAQVNVGHIHLPIGISFFTFQIMSYVIDLYRGKAEVQRNPFSLGLYISLFPQLIAGPIVRYIDIAKQLAERRVTIEGFAYGVRRFIVGLGKKVLIANVVAMSADKIFAIPAIELTPGIAWLGLITYTLQLYFDFSGYSDMAIGIGRMFGFTFLENFNYPYMARSLRQFWQRWHISLTTWFRDYLYFPLGGSRVTKARGYFNLMFVFVLTGLWHGANWTFIVWGFWHGAFLLLERILPDNFFESLWRPLGNFYTMMVVMISLVMFRSDTLTYSVYYTLTLFGLYGGSGLHHSVMLFLNSELIIAIIIGCIGSYPFIPWVQKKYKEFSDARGGIIGIFSNNFYASMILASLVIIMILSAMSLASDTYNPFIYFRF